MYLRSENLFIARVANKQIEKIKSRLYDEFSFEKRSRAGKTFQDTIIDLLKSISSYLGIYKDAHNYQQFENELRGQARAIIVQLFKGTSKNRRFPPPRKSDSRFSCSERERLAWDSLASSI